MCLERMEPPVPSAQSQSGLLVYDPHPHECENQELLLSLENYSLELPLLWYAAASTTVSATVMTRNLPKAPPLCGGHDLVLVFNSFKLFVHTSPVVFREFGFALILRYPCMIFFLHCNQ